jgi:NAD(P)-dependent dehydrogenase (short-subunit alcohol dehydrogenase family)
MELAGKTAIITGSTGGLGSALARRLAAAGCNCVCHYHQNEEKAEKIVRDIEAMSRQAIAVKADLTEPEQIAALFEAASRLSRLQILINSAALFERTPLSQISVGRARRVFDLNLTACILTTKGFAQRVARDSTDKDPSSLRCAGASSPAGKIINICDVAGIKPWAEYSLYCASKAGLIGATKALAKELAPAITVNALCPGIAQAEMDAEEEKRQLSFIPLRRFAERKEIAAAMMYLLENDYVTGQVLNVCGGRAI